jgi:hypothetical protein
MIERRPCSTTLCAPSAAPSSLPVTTSGWLVWRTRSTRLAL